jgi:hypothetical protein
LSNGKKLDEQSLSGKNAFGLHSSLLFQYCRQLAAFNLNKIQFTLLCSLKFFTSDRPFLLERIKVQQIQNKYIELFEHSLEAATRSNNSANKISTDSKPSLSPNKSSSSMLSRSQQISNHKSTVQMANILLSFVQLRALDVLSKFFFIYIDLMVF